MKNFTILVCCIYGCFLANSPQLKHYYSTASDAKYFDRLKNLVGSIHRFDYENLGEIAVFDLGFTRAQRGQLQKMYKVSLHSVEVTHSDILKKFTVPRISRLTIGHFAWKPVVIKQALDLFPYVLYLDAGITVLKPLDNLFEFINKNGYFFLSYPSGEQDKIKNRTISRVVRHFCDLSDEIWQKSTIAAGIQGLTRQMLDSYVIPMYRLSYDISLFEDDGSAPFGLGQARHDQILFSIHAYKLDLVPNQIGWSVIEINSGKKKIHVHWNTKELNCNTIIALSSAVQCSQYIRYSKK